MINVEVKKTKDKQVIKYPCLMIADDGEIVLFTYYECGTSIAESKDGIGHHSTGWEMSYFKPFHGSITLSNKE